MDKMLDKQAVKEMADLFFNGQPEKAYTMCKPVSMCSVHAKLMSAAYTLFLLFYHLCWLSP